MIVQDDVGDCFMRGDPHEGVIVWFGEVFVVWGGKGDEMLLWFFGFIVF